jgi:serine/threonine protein kinase
MNAPPDHIGDHRIVEPLARGGQAQTYLAEPRDSGDQRVVLKVLAFSRLDDWKARELFERESRTLERLDHPAIPTYLDAFERTDEQGRPEFVLVQEYVPGDRLADTIEAGWTADGTEARDLLRELLEILAYLHELNPPVVHRDVKPSNLIRRPDGDLALVDFGAVQTILPETVGGSTIVGTTGYMPPEQLMGRAVPASDVYAAGATAVHALSGIPPDEIPVTRMRLDYEEFVDVSPKFRRILDRMLAPEADERFASATDALRALDGPSDTETDRSLAPVTTDLTDASWQVLDIEADDQQLTATIPAADTWHIVGYLALLGTFVSSLLVHEWVGSASLQFLLGFVLVIGIAIHNLFESTARHRIELTEDGLTLSKSRARLWFPSMTRMWRRQLRPSEVDSVDYDREDRILTVRDENGTETKLADRAAYWRTDSPDGADDELARLANLLDSHLGGDR